MCEQTFKCGWSPNWREVIRLQTPGAAYNEFGYHEHLVITSSYYRPQGNVLYLSVILFTGGGLCPGGSLPKGSLSRGVSDQVWGLCPEGLLCPGGGLCQGDLPYGYVRAVRILVECILVFSEENTSDWHQWWFAYSEYHF